MEDRRNIVLTGFMGCGKTVVGRLAAERLSRPFVDMDEVIAQRLGMPVKDVFRRLGEPFFRREEAALCRELAERRGLVIATGGGALVDRGNRESLGRGAVAIRLAASPEALWERVEHAQDRPLLATRDRRAGMEELLARREAAYLEVPHQVNTTGRSLDEVADLVIGIAENAERVGERWIGVHHPGGFYPVFITRGGLASTGIYLGTRGLQGSPVVITDDAVGPLWGEMVGQSVPTEGPPAQTLAFPHGERHKTLDTVQDLVAGMIAAGFGRDTTVIALGGGVVGDTAGLVAALYMRGVPLVQLPTTLLAAFDSSVGGKVAVDLPAGKNLVGAFKQPELVLIDVEAMGTLPEEERRSGLAEAVKHGLIADPVLFEMLRKGSYDLAEVVERSVRVKAEVVEVDPYEHGRRAVLNLGHTFGHAFEKLSHFRLRHGEGVAIGMVLACRLAAHRGLCLPSLVEEVSACLRQLGLPTEPPDYPAAAVIEAMQSDKKKRGGQLRFVLPVAMGDVRVYDDISGEELESLLGSELGPAGRAR